MIKLSHAQAQGYLHLGQGVLSSAQAEQLARHLQGCRACRDYAALQAQLAPVITHQMHARWDAWIENHLPESLPALSRRSALSFKRVLAVVAGVLLLAATFLAGPLLLRRTLPPIASPPNGLLMTIATPLDTEPTPAPGFDPAPERSSLPFQLDPVICAAQSTPAPRGVVLPYPAQGVIDGGEIQNGDFTFSVWLYCDESLRPDDPEHFSDLAGLGVFSRWTYHGPKIEGEFWDMVGVDPDVRMVTGSPMLSNSGASMGMGLHLPEEPAAKWNIAALASRGDTIPFVVKVQSVDGVYGAELSFKLKAGENGYLPYEIELRALPIESLATQPQIEIPEKQELALVEAPIARYPAANGLLAFASGGSESSEIYTMQADGSGLVNLTNHPAIDTYPVWSPDGRRIVFLSDRRSEGVMDVYVMNADGSQPRLVYALPAQPPEPEAGEAGEKPTVFWLSWSPDSQYILAEALLADVSLDGKAEKCLVIARADGDGGMCVSNLDFTAPQWSPDGKYISYAKQLNQISRTIVVLDVAALFTEDVLRERTVYSQDGWQVSSQAQWSPDGQYLAGNIVNEATMEVGLWVGPVSGGAGDRIASLGTAFSSQDVLVAPSDISPAWSPDGAWIAFAGQNMLQVIRPDGSQQTDLLAVEALRSVSWSPDGRYILFNAGEQSQAYLLDVAAALADPGHEQAVLLEVDPELYHWFFAWQPVLP